MLSRTDAYKFVLVLVIGGTAVNLLISSGSLSGGADANGDELAKMRELAQSLQEQHKQTMAAAAALSAAAAQGAAGGGQLETGGEGFSATAAAAAAAAAAATQPMPTTGEPQLEAAALHSKDWKQGDGYHVTLHNRNPAALAVEAAASCGSRCQFPISGQALSPPQERYAFEGHDVKSNGGWSQQTHPARAVMEILRSGETMSMQAVDIGAAGGNPECGPLFEGQMKDKDADKGTRSCTGTAGEGLHSGKDCATTWGLVSRESGDEVADRWCRVVSGCDLFFSSQVRWGGAMLDPRAQHLTPIKGVQRITAAAEPPTIAQILWDHCVPHDIDILKLDIDCYDYDVAEAILRHGYRPKVFAAEISASFPPPVHMHIGYHPDYHWTLISSRPKGQQILAGASLSAYSDLLRPLGYTLVNVDYYNVLFVQTKYIHLFGDIPTDDMTAWRVGWFDRPERKHQKDLQKHWINHPTMENWMAVQDDDARLEMIRKEVTEGNGAGGYVRADFTPWTAEQVATSDMNSGGPKAAKHATAESPCLTSK
eukprot:SAG22_NODE_183_length_16031_cov_36.647000_16_plen_539_part_00